MDSRHITRLGLALSLLLPAVGLGQSNAENRIIGWANSGRANAAGRIEIQDINPRCQTARVRCANVGSFAGSGLAYDPVTQAAWVCDGTSIKSYPMAGRCTTNCRARPAKADLSATITALAIDPVSRVLWHLETRPGYARIIPYSIKGCPMPLRGGCTLRMQNRETAGGLAYDRINKLFYVAVSFPAFVGYISSVRVIDAVTCRHVCTMPLPYCNVRTQPAITGLAYDHCSKRLYYSTGPTVEYLIVNDPRKCQSRSVVPCCAKGGSLPWADIDILPGWTAKTTGSGCVGRGCAFCRQLVMGTGGGDPTLGNQGFFLTVRGTPINAIGAVYLGVGPCGAGLKIPALCGPFYPNLAAVFLLAGVPLNGRSQCTGAANIPLSIPNDVGICGVKVCFQTLVVCGASGLGLTAGLDFQFAKN